MKVHEYREMMRYLTRKPLSEREVELAYMDHMQKLNAPAPTQVASSEERVLDRQPFYQEPKELVQDDSASPPAEGIPLYQGVQPGVAIEERMPIYLPPDMAPVTPSAPGIPNPQDRQIELAKGGRAKFGEGSKLTGTDKTLEQNVRDDHKAFNDYRKSIGSPTIPLDNEYIRMWIRTRLNSGGPVKNQTPKFIPMDLESVAFRLFKQNLDNLTYNEKQSVYDYIEENRNKKAIGGRVKLQNGSDDGYVQEIPSLGFNDPIDILEQQMINEKNIDKILALNWKLTEMKEKKFEQETKAAEYKKSQKEKGIKYKEDFPSESDYFLKTAEQFLTNPKYFLGKGFKGAAETTEWLAGQSLKTLFNQEGKNFEFYHPVAGEKLGINKYIEKNIPKNPTTGTLFLGETAEIAGSVMDPFLAYGIAKGAIKGTKAKPPTTAVDETIDPTRRDILKTGAVMGTGALLYPTAKKLDLLKLGSSIKPSVFAEAVKGTTAPSWMDSLMTKIIKEGTEIKMPKESSIIKKEVKFKNPETGDVQTATLTIDSKSDRMFIEYDSPTNVADQPVVLELYRERKAVKNRDGKSFHLAPDKTKGYRFETTETGPRVTDWDGNIEFDAEDSYRKIIELKSDISGLKSYATEGKGIDKKIAKEKKAATADIEKNPSDYVSDWEPEIYD